MSGEEQEQVLENLYRTMNSWSREKMRDWIYQVIGDDEEMRPFIEELYEQKDITNEQLIRIFRSIFAGGSDTKPDAVNPNENTIFEKENVIPKYPASTSSTESDVVIVPKRRAMKLDLSESSDTDLEDSKTQWKGQKVGSNVPLNPKSAKHLVSESKKVEKKLNCDAEIGTSKGPQGVKKHLKKLKEQKREHILEKPKSKVDKAVQGEKVRNVVGNKSAKRNDKCRPDGKQQKAISGQKKEQHSKIKFREISGKKRRPCPKVRYKNDPIYLDPDYSRFRKRFKLRPVTVVLYNIKHQSLPWRSGDQVYRAQLTKDIRKRKEERRVQEKKKYSKLGTRILPFERRPKDAEVFKKKKRESGLANATEKSQANTNRNRVKESLKKNMVKKIPKVLKTAHNDIQNLPKKYEELKKIYPTFGLGKSFSFASPIMPTAVARVPICCDKERLAIPEKELSNNTKQLEITPKQFKIPSLNFRNPVAPEKKVVEVDLTADDQFDVDHQSTINFNHAAEVPICFTENNQKTSLPPSLISQRKSNDVLRKPDFPCSSTNIVPPQPNSDKEDLFTRKCAEWIHSSECEPFCQTYLWIPEKDEENFHTSMAMASLITGDDDIGYRCSQSNQEDSEEEEEDLQDTGIRQNAEDPDIADEYCGASLLACKIRVQAGDGSGCFKDLFHVPRGCNYDKNNFKAKCNLCEENITDRRNLSAHVRSKSHKEILASTSLKLLGVVSTPWDSENSLKSSGDIVNNKSDGGNGSNPKGSSTESKRKSYVRPENGVAVKKSRFRSRSPHGRRHRTRSRSRRRESHSRPRSQPYRRFKSRPYRRNGHDRSRSRTQQAGKQRRFENKGEQSFGTADRQHSPPKRATGGNVLWNRVNESVVEEKLMLQKTGKWTQQLAASWKLWTLDQEKLKDKITEKRKTFLEETPEAHPMYEEEWLKFWEKRSQELTHLGKDVENHDYVSEWKVHWAKLINEILDNEMAVKAQTIREMHGIDLDTLKALNSTNPPAPNRVPLPEPLVPPPPCLSTFQSPLIPRPAVPPGLPVCFNHPPPFPANPIIAPERPFIRFNIRPRTFLPQHW